MGREADKKNHAKNWEGNLKVQPMEMDKHALEGCIKCGKQADVLWPLYTNSDLSGSLGGSPLGGRNFTFLNWNLNFPKTLARVAKWKLHSRIRGFRGGVE